jgi:hypothetical protein
LPKGYKGIQMPYEARPAQEIIDRVANFPDLGKLGELVDQIENGEHEDYEIIDSCGSGACPIV